MGERLTETKIRALPAPTSGQAEYPDSDVPGLRVRVGARGTKTFILRRRVAGRSLNVTVGRYDSDRFNLTDARAKARTILSDIEKKGALALKTKAKSFQGTTLRAMLPDYISYARDEKKNRGWAETHRTFHRHILPVLGDRFADTITRGDITRMVDALPSPGAKRAAFAAISAFYTWAMPRYDTLVSHPARDAEKPEQSASRKRVLDDAELADVWNAASTLEAPWGDYFHGLILTGKRRAEVAQLDWRELDRDTATWIVPGDRTKNGEDDIVPLTAPMVAMLDRLAAAKQARDRQNLIAPTVWPNSGPVFTTDGKKAIAGYSKAKAMIDAALTKLRTQRGDSKGIAAWRVHDLRRTLATGLQRIGVRFEVTEAVLNHLSGSRSGVAGIYQRHRWLGEKRAALAAWAEEVARMADRSGK